MKVFRKILFISVLMFVLFPTNLMSQYYSASNVSQRRVFFGGNLGFQFGSESVFDISPIIGIKLMPRISVGVGLSYQWYSRDGDFVDYSTSIYGGRVFSAFDLVNDVYLQFEYEYLNYAGSNDRRIKVWNYLVGGGYRQWIGANVYMNFMLLFNINDSANSPYTNPFYRVGIEVGL